MSGTKILWGLLTGDNRKKYAIYKEHPIISLTVVWLSLMVILPRADQRRGELSNPPVWIHDEE
jgi:hypothetical protein